jgi:hypothetical protein
VKKEKSSTLFYSHLDNQRLQETFFSPQKKQARPKKKKVFFIPVISILVILLFVIIFNYDFILIPRSHLSVTNKGSSLLSKDILSSVSFIGQNDKLMRVKRSLVYLTIPEGEKVGIKFDFKTPINLNQNDLFFWIKKANTTINMEVVVKDIRFFSNAKSPAKIIMDKNLNSSYNKIPIQFQRSAWPNVNLARINQIKIYFYQSSNQLSLADASIRFKEKDWILIKDIDLVKKEDK